MMLVKCLECLIVGLQFSGHENVYVYVVLVTIALGCEMSAQCEQGLSRE